MDGYPSPYLTHSRPFILLSGLNEDVIEGSEKGPLSNGPRISSQVPPLKDDRTHTLEAAFLKFDPWDSRINASSSPTPLSSNIFRLKSCGRQYTLPCRKASPLASEVGSSVGSPGSLSLRSPLSPLAHGSPLFMDGVMTPLWLTKYSDAIPAVFVSFFPIGFDPQNDVLNDNRLKAEINSIRSSLGSSNYGINLAVILIADESFAQCSNVDERLGNIRKMTKLENGSSFFLLPFHIDSSDFGHFAQSVLSGIRPTAMEFYKNHYKKSRRKKDKSVDSDPTTPTMEGINQSLPKIGWTIRSEYKMAIFSEFRFEMDAAARHHKAAVDLLMETGGLFDVYPSWSPRWNELRLLADTCALRRIRCLLANGLTSSAARFWRVYRDRTQQLLERKGKGTMTYGWKAWEARFAKCMAEVIQSMFHFVTDANARKLLEVITPKQRLPFVSPEKSMQAEVLAPLEYLHHPGYWLKLSANYSEARRVLAQKIAKEDLVPPGQSPATRVARRSEVFDTFLCPEPHIEGSTYDHAAEIIDLLEKAKFEFAERKHSWMVERLRVYLASFQTLASKGGANEFDVSWKNNTWRDSSWYPLVKEVATEVHLLARTSRDYTTQILTTWELLNSHFGKTEGVEYDINWLLEQADNVQRDKYKEINRIAIEHEDTVSFLNVNLCFEKQSENLGEALRAQISIHSNAHYDSPAVTLTYVDIDFYGNVPGIEIVHSADTEEDDSNNSIREVEVKMPSTGMNYSVGAASLTLHPQQTKVFTFSMPAREPGKISVDRASAGIKKGTTVIEYHKSLEIDHNNAGWLLVRNGKLCSPRLVQRSSNQEVEILPKLPKLKLHLPSLAEKYYVGERILLDLELVNDEIYKINGSVEVRFSENHQDEAPSIKILEDFASSDEDTENAALAIQDSCNFNNLAPSQVEKKVVVVQMPQSSVDEIKLDFEVRYSQIEHGGDTVSKTISAKLTVVEPFKTTFGVTPDLHPGLWPSFFDVTNEPSSISAKTEQPLANHGMPSRWTFQPQITSLAETALTVEKIEIDLHSVNEGTLANVRLVDAESTNIDPGQDYNFDVTIDITKQEMEDVTPAVMNPVLSIYWRRTDSKSSRLFQKFISAPKLSLPTSEPRVIATVGPIDEESVKIQLHLENPSLHYLSFEVGIEPNDDFAFSGPGLADVHLVPYSRLTVPFILAPLVRGTWVQPVFKVVDMYFNKSLRINAGKGVMRDPRSGALIIWVGS